MDAVERARARLDRSLNGILGLIALEFLIGMWLNLWGSFPSSSTFPAAVSDTSQPLLVLHIVLGLLMGLGAIVLVVIAHRDAYRAMQWFALGGLIGVGIAGLSGSSFVMSGYSNAYASFAMAVGFAISLTSYYEGLVALRGHPLPKEPAPMSPGPASTGS